MKKEVVTGEHVRIIFDAARCVHSRECVLSRPDVFVPNVAGDWIHPDRATPAEIAELAHRCPSGAIRYEPVGESPVERPPIVNTVRVRENGPLAVHAELVVAGAAAGFRATLCRCGRSARKPYCDGAHATAAFRATGEPATQDSSPLPERGGVLAITAVADGPLHVQGNLEVVTATGRTANRVTETWLCRCGHSAHKPYCDGSHRTAQFRAGGEPA